MGVFERFLSIWVGLAMLGGVLLGTTYPAIFKGASSLEIAHVNIPVAVFIWLMIFPMMVQIDFTALKDIRNQRD